VNEQLANRWAAGVQRGDTTALDIDYQVNKEQSKCDEKKRGCLV